MIKSIRLQMALLACLISLAAVNCQAQSAETPTQPKQLTIAAMQAKLFYENTGQFSPDLFTNYVNLFNTPMGEEASGSMLVTVEVKAGSKDWYPSGRKVQLTARYRIADFNGRSRPAFFSKTIDINIGSDQKFFAGFWLYETGCHPVTLTARILGQKGSLRKTINMRCGE